MEAPIMQPGPTENAGADPLADYLSEFDAFSKAHEATAPQSKTVVLPTHLLYTSEKSATAYTEAKKNKAYGGGDAEEKNFHDETLALYKTAAADICGRLGKFTFVDLGPEWPDKAWPVMEYAAGIQGLVKTLGLLPELSEAPSAPSLGTPPKKIDGASFSKKNDDNLIHGNPVSNADYWCVDINPLWSEAYTIIGTLARNGGGYLGRFEDAVGTVPKNYYPTKLVNIGLTFMNFTPSHGFRMMKRIAGPNSYIIFAQHLITQKNNIKKILKLYSNEDGKNTEMQEIAFGPLRAAGIAEDAVDYDVRFNQMERRVEAGFIFRGPTRFELDAYQEQFQAGDRLVTITSDRRTEKELKRLVSRDKDLEETGFWRSPSEKTALVMARVKPTFTYG